MARNAIGAGDLRRRGRRLCDVHQPEHVVALHGLQEVIGDSQREPLRNRRPQVAGRHRGEEAIDVGMVDPQDCRKRAAARTARCPRLARAGEHLHAGQRPRGLRRGARDLRTERPQAAEVAGDGRSMPHGLHCLHERLHDARQATDVTHGGVLHGLHEAFDQCRASKRSRRAGHAQPAHQAIALRLQEASLLPGIERQRAGDALVHLERRSPAMGRLPFVARLIDARQQSLRKIEVLFHGMLLNEGAGTQPPGASLSEVARCWIAVREPARGRQGDVVRPRPRGTVQTG